MLERYQKMDMLMHQLVYTQRMARFSSLQAEGEVDIQKKLSETLLAVSTENLTAEVSTDLETSLRASIDSSGDAYDLDAALVAIIQASAAGQITSGSLDISGKIKAEGELVINGAFGSASSDISLSLDVDADVSIVSKLYNITISATAGVEGFVDLYGGSGSANVTFGVNGNPEIGNSSLEFGLELSGEYIFEGDNGSSFDYDIYGGLRIEYIWR